MSVTVKSSREIELMKKAGEILAITHEELQKIVKPGISTWEIDKKGEEIIRSYNCIPSFLNYNGFPGSICVSINDEVVHGIPSKKRYLKDGDIVSLDAGVIWKGYHSDAARTHAVGEITEEAKKLIRVTEEAFYAGVAQAREGNRLNDICTAIGKYAMSRGYGVVRELVGHGIGTSLHESPEIPNFKMNSRGIKLCAGMTFAIEPMINIGRADVVWLDDDWTVATEDGTLSSHYENTILITKGEPEILSLRK